MNRQTIDVGRVHVGCSGWNYREWKQRVYPQGLPARRWLEHYASLFDTVEVNNTFYRLASSSAVSGWAQQTPSGFVFSIKASRYMTHVKRLNDLEPGIKRFYEPLTPLSRDSKLGPIVWQLPPDFARNDERLETALKQLPSGIHCIEFRHPSWFCDPIYDLLSRYNAALVVGDHPDRPFQALRLTTSWTLVRLHQGQGSGGRYTDREIKRWAEQLQAWREQAEIYAYFNNDQRAYAVENATTLKELVA